MIFEEKILSLSLLPSKTSSSIEKKIKRTPEKFFVSSQREMFLQPGAHHTPKKNTNKKKQF